MSEYRNLAKNTIIFAVGQFSVKLIQFFLMPILTIALTTEAYGRVESLASLAELIIPLFTLGLQDAVFRFCMRKDVENKTVLSSTLAVISIGTILVAAGVIIAANWLDSLQCFLFAALYVVYSLTNIFGQYVRGCGYVKTYAIGGIVQALLLAGATAVLVYWRRMGANGYLLSMILSGLAFIVLLFFAGKIYRNISFKALDKCVLKEMLLYALPLIPNAIGWWFVQVVNRYVLIGFIGESAAGLYVSSSKIATIINIFGTIFLQAWTISTVNSLNDKDKGAFNTRVFQAFSTFIQAAAFGILLLLPFISRFLLKGAFYEAWHFSSIAIFTAVISCYGSFFGAFYGANMKTKVVFVSTFAGAVVNTAACFLLVWLLGIYGALYAGILGYSILLIIRIVTTEKYSHIKINWFKEIAVMLLLFADTLLIAYGEWIPVGLYWGAQAVAICLFVLLSFKDIKRLICDTAKFCKKFFRKNKKPILASNAADSDGTLTDSEQIENDRNIRFESNEHDDANREGKDAERNDRRNS